MLVTRCEAGFVQEPKGTKGNKMYSLLSSEKRNQTYKAACKSAVWNLHHSADLRGPAKCQAWTGLGHIYAFISPLISYLTDFLFEPHRQTLRMLGDTALPVQYS